MLRHRAGQRCAQVAVAIGELPLDLADVPAHAVQRPVDVGAGQPPRLADLPDQQQRQQIAMRGQRVDRLGDARLALVQADLRPVAVLLAGSGDGLDRRIEVDTRRAGDRGAVDRRHVVARGAHPPPLAVHEVAEPVGVEGLGGHVHASGVGLPPRGAALQRQAHAPETMGWLTGLRTGLVTWITTLPTVRRSARSVRAPGMSPSSGSSRSMTGRIRPSLAYPSSSSQISRR